MFRSASENFEPERRHRAETENRLLPFGVSFLDDALLGIRPDDLVIVGAPSGVGKTQFCTTLAEATIVQGKHVHYFALEADEFEIERRIRFAHLANLYYSRPGLKRAPIHYDEWECGFYDDVLSDLEVETEKYCTAAFKNLHTYYKQGKFGVEEFIKQFCAVANKTDLIIVDHVHYFDWSGQNDNEAMKEIAKTARDLVNQFKIPIVLVAHLRKRDRNSTELVAGLDEFHGSSDLAKIATKAVTIASGGPNLDGPGFVTFMRTPKNRKFGGVTRSQARIVFNDRTGAYKKDYQVGPANEKTFAPFEPGSVPSWFGRTKRRNGGDRDRGV